MHFKLTRVYKEPANIADVKY